MGPCARGSKKEGKPKCLPQSKAQSLGKKGRASAASKKRREDPNPNRKGKAINVATKSKRKTNETVIDNYINQFEQQLDELKCWSGYTRVKGVPQGKPGSCKKKVNEIVTVDELMPLSFDKLILIDQITDKHYKDNIYYGYSGSSLVVASKENNQMTACAVCVKYKNPHYDLLPEYYVPKNMYSWIKDNGITTTNLIKAIIQISDIPVLSDLEMTPYAKKSFKKKIENNDINAKIFNICDGTISAYDSNIWENDDECRVIFFEHRMGKPQITLSESQKLLMNHKYKWKDIVKYKNWKYQ